MIQDVIKEGGNNSVDWENLRKLSTSADADKHMAFKEVMKAWAESVTEEEARKKVNQGKQKEVPYLSKENAIAALGQYLEYLNESKSDYFLNK